MEHQPRRDPMGSQPRPEPVQKARLAQNTAALSAMGTKGAHATNLKRDLEKASDAALAERKAKQLKDEMDQRAIQANEHIIDPDTQQAVE